VSPVRTSGVALAELTTLRVGGPAGHLVEVERDDQLVEAVAAADRSGEPVLVLGGGSNLLVADAGFPGTVVTVRTSGLRSEDGTAVTVAAGEDWDDVVARTVDEGLAGLECLSGIPGRTGATPIQNVGAYGQEVAQTITGVRAWDRQTHEVVTLDPAACGFAYRHSRFKAEPGRWVVLDVTFRLERSALSAPVRYAELARVLGIEVGRRAPLAQVREAVLGLRRSKGMVLDAADHDTWSAGSFFTNPVLDAATSLALPSAAPRWPQPDGRVKTSAAWLIEQAGFGKGFALGAPDGPSTARARLSTKHTLALTNRGGASAADLLELARAIRAGVRERFGVELVPEPVLVGVTL